MRQLIIHILMVFLSFMVLCFGAWTYTQSIYTDNIRKAFTQKTETSMANLKNVSVLADKNVIVSGTIQADETFKSRTGEKVVLERYKEEKETAKGWKDINESILFKVVSFKLKNGNESVIIDPFGLDKTYLGEPISSIENVNGEKIKKSHWVLKPNQKITILGNVDNKSGIIVINNPNIYNSIIDNTFKKVPFIITTMKKNETADKASDIGKSIYYSSLALFAVGIFFIFTSIGNVMKHYQVSQNNF